MVVMGGGGKWWLLSLLISVGIFAVLYFTVIKPTTDTANDAIRTSMQQVAQGQKLSNCIQAAGSNSNAIHRCQRRFGP